MTCNFSYTHYQEIFQTALNEGYQVITLADWFGRKYDTSRKVLINRVDVDANPARLARMGGVFESLGISASIFLRLHGTGYNLLLFDNINLVRWLASQGNEIGLHTEIEDARHICGLDPEKLLREELELFDAVFGVRPQGVASHGSLTPYNNLDFWKDHRPEEFGLAYEAYDHGLWTGCRYVSDSEYVRWKAYDNGVLRAGDRRCACDHLREGAPVVYLLTHTCSWYHRHIHEQACWQPGERPV